jgi:hypothetical protein
MSEQDGVDPTALMQVFFELQNASQGSLKLRGVSVQPFGDITREGQPRLPIDCAWLSVTLKETASGMVGSFNYKTDLFEPKTLKCWVTDYKTILARAAADAETLLGHLADR